MSDLERAKLIPVSGNNDTPDLNNAVDVQFNPVTLKVSLSNTLKPNKNSGSRAVQFVDKSSSTLAVELMFDTTYVETSAASGESDDTGQSGSQSETGDNRIEQGSDVRQQTRKIADKFMKPVESGDKLQAPSRVLFQWGSIEFIGMVQSYDETLDFFSPKGRPLRATVALKLSEDRYQFRSNDSDALAAEQTPELAFTGNGAAPAGDPGNGAPSPDQNTNPVPGGSDGPGSWRDNALFNGIESPRLPSTAALALPNVSLGAGAGFGISGGAGIGVSAGFGVSAGVGGSSSLSLSLGASSGGASTGAVVGSSQQSSSGASATQASGSTAAAVGPAFRYGNSTALGTGIPGAFHANPKAGLSASSLQLGATSLRKPQVTTGAGMRSSPSEPSDSQSDTPARSPRQRHGISVAALLKKSDDSGVGFD